MNLLARRQDGAIGIGERARPPILFTRIMTPDRSEGTREWMSRHSVMTFDVESAAWRRFLQALLLTFGLMASLSLLLGSRTLVYMLLPVVLVPLLLANRVANSPSRQAKMEQRAYLRESPETIGTLVMNMRIQPSLEWAMGRVSQTCSGELTKRFVLMGWEVLTRRSESVERSLLAFVPRLSGPNEAVGRSLHLILASTYEPNLASRDRVLDRANLVALEGVKEAADRYVASLSNPALIIFALGIMLPVMLFSIAPLLSIGVIGDSGGGDTASMFDVAWLFFLLLIVVPIACLLFANGALGANPLAEVPQLVLPDKSMLLLPIGLSSVLSIALILFVQGELLPYCLVLSFFIPLCLVMGVRTRHRKQEGTAAQRAGFISALFQIGSRMAGGASFEKSLEEMALTAIGTPFGGCAGRALRRARLDRAGLDELLERELLPLSGPDIAQAFVIVCRAAEKDIQYAGRLALNLARNFSDVRAAEMKMEENLHGVVDMMLSTGTIFAPVVLGVTSSLMAVTVGAGLSSSGTIDLQIMMAMIYLSELVLCVCYFTNFLRRDRSWRDLAGNFAKRCPIALVVFTAVSLFARAGLSQLM